MQAPGHVLLPSIVKAEADVATCTRYVVAVATAPQLSVGVVDTPLAPSEGTGVVGPASGGIDVVKLHVADQSPPWLALPARTCQ